MPTSKTFAERMLAVLSLFVTLLSLFTTAYIQYEVHQVTADLTARSVTSTPGVVTLCINHPPSLTFPCNATVSQNVTYTCQLNGADPDIGSAISYTVSSQISLGMNASGYLNFTPGQQEVGPHELLFTIDDGSSCPNSNASVAVNLTVININDAPYLARTIPDVNLTVNTTYYPFYLNDYFADPDYDPLTYTATIPGAPLSLILQSDSGVAFRSGLCINGSLLVVFTATDPYNLSTESNPVSIRILCASTTSTGNGSGAQDGGGGGGGSAFTLCQSEWQCLDWFPCLPTGFEWQHCYDLEGCEDPKFLKRACEYKGEIPVCDENWLCEEWGPCFLNNTRVRSCTDLNLCGSTAYRPVLVEECVYLPSCDDGIRNGEETGIDCGGPCGPCPLLETPGAIASKRFDAWMLFIILISALTVVGLERIYHDRLMRVAARIALLLARRHPREILLTEEQMRSLLDKLLAAEREALAQKGEEAEKRYERATTVAREFLSILARVELSFSAAEFRRGLAGRRMSRELRSILSSFEENLYALEAEKVVFDVPYFYSLTEELRTLILSVSQSGIADIERPLSELEITDDQSFVDQALIRIVRIYRALQFAQEDLAKLEYAELLRLYEDLPKQDQEPVYKDLSRVFAEFLYVVEHKA